MDIIEPRSTHVDVYKPSHVDVRRSLSGLFTVYLLAIFSFSRSVHIIIGVAHSLSAIPDAHKLDRPTDIPTYKQ